MTRETILKKAIEKAIKGGYKIEHPGLITKDFLSHIIKGCEYYGVIFEHDFAKAFWGKGRVDIKGSMAYALKYLCEMKNWEYHLQQMVLEEDKIKYLGKFI